MSSTIILGGLCFLFPIFSRCSLRLSHNGDKESEEMGRFLLNFFPFTALLCYIRFPGWLNRGRVTLNLGLKNFVSLIYVAAFSAEYWGMCMTFALKMPVYFALLYFLSEC